MPTAEVYDKADWHPGTSWPHLQALLEWLRAHQLLNAYGLDELSTGVDEEFAITADMLTEPGNAVMRQAYRQWLHAIRPGSPISTAILDEALAPK